MNEPVWLALDLVIDFHSEQLAMFGGPAGLRDRGLLESALGRPQAKFGYEAADLAALAGAYAFDIARNHPFIDGNKRAAFASIIVFLGLNGIEFLVPEAEATVAILALAAGELTEENLARWIRDNLPK